MTYYRIWRFRPPAGSEQAFAKAYAPQGPWAKLFETHPGFQSTELLRPALGEGWWLTIDRWNSRAAFDDFQQNEGDAYRALDAALEGIAGEELFVGDFEGQGEEAVTSP